MRDDQTIRSIGIGVIAVLYIARLVTVGNGHVVAFGYEINPFVTAGLFIILLAAPETLDKLPVGPSRSGK